MARKVAATKPVIALFGGRTGVGGRAAAAHTGAIANDDAAIDAFCAACGILRVESLRRLLVAAKAFGAFPPGLGPRVLVLSNSGGPGVLCTDRAAAEGLDLGALPAAMAAAAGGASRGSLGRQSPRPAGGCPGGSLRPYPGNCDHRGLQAFDTILGIHVVPFMVEAGRSSRASPRSRRKCRCRSSTA